MRSLIQPDSLGALSAKINTAGVSDDPGRGLPCKCGAAQGLLSFDTPLLRHGVFGINGTEATMFLAVTRGEFVPIESTAAAPPPLPETFDPFEATL